MSVVVEIPLSEGAPLPFFDLHVPLEGVTYTLQIRWNPRASSWYMDVLDEQGTVVRLAGLRLVVNWPLAAYATGRSPPGVFIAIDNSGENRDPELTDLGVRVKLLYFTSTEMGL